MSGFSSTSVSDIHKSAIPHPHSKWIFALAFAFLLNPITAKTQETKKLPRVGFLTAGSSSTIAARIAALRLGLRELGYVEGKTIIIEWRFGEGKLDRLPKLAAELAGLNVEVIVSAGSQVTRPLRDATRKIPIVMAQDTDPLRNGFVVSLARPGGNVTGLSSYSAELNGKRVDLLRETVTKLSRLAVIGQSTYPGNTEALKESEAAAGVLKLHLEYLDVRTASDIDGAFLDAAKRHAGAVLVLQSAVINSHRKALTDVATKTRLPTIYYAPEFLDSGGLMSYAASINDLYRRSAAYVDKILKGAKPTDLPVEQPTKFEFIVNLKAAKQIRLLIPPNVLARADRVIK